MTKIFSKRDTAPIPPTNKFVGFLGAKSVKN